MSITRFVTAGALGLAAAAVATPALAQEPYPCQLVRSSRPTLPEARPTSWRA